MNKFLVALYMGLFVILLSSVLTVNTDLLSVIGGLSAGYTYITN